MAGLWREGRINGRGDSSDDLGALDHPEGRRGHPVAS